VCACGFPVFFLPEMVNKVEYLKWDESATHPEAKFRVRIAFAIACLSISRGVWT